MSPSHFLHFLYVSSVIIVVWFGALRQDLMHETLVDLEFGVLLLQVMYFAGPGFHGGFQLLPLRAR